MVLFLGILHLSLPNRLTFAASINVVVEIYLTLSPRQNTPEWVVFINQFILLLLLMLYF